MYFSTLSSVFSFLFLNETSTIAVHKILPLPLLGKITEAGLL
jgi:hypothetical protein